MFVDFLLAGVVSATIMWLISNKFLREPSSESVEWGYSFDVHINAQFPPLIILHFVMLIFYKVLFSQEWFVARLLGNALWLLATGYYIYITFLGYNCKWNDRMMTTFTMFYLLPGIPHLKKSRTKMILALMPILVLFHIVTIIIGWNLNISLMNFYHYRVL